jgi:Spy/CpxP family protein refolding chaperone
MTATEPTPPPAYATPPRRRRRWIGIALGTILGIIVGAALTAGFVMHRGWHHGWLSARVNLEKVNERIERGVRHALDRVDATAIQKRKVTTILRQAASDLWPLREQHRAAREEVRELLAAATIDRERLEALRASQLQLGETASKRLAQALADAAEVLTPEQRARFAELMERWRRRPWG